MTTLTELAIALAATPLAAGLRASAWAYPAVEFVHLVSMGLLFGSIAVVDLRLAGIGRQLPVGTLLRRALPLTVGALVLVAASGLLLFVAHADELVGNRAFLVKLALIGLGLANAGWFHLVPYRNHALGWNTDRPPPATARICALLSILTWILVIGAGRLIAYV